MQIIFNKLKEATDFIEKVNKNFPGVDCHFENVKGEVHVILEKERFM